MSESLGAREMLWDSVVRFVAREMPVDSVVCFKSYPLDSNLSNG